MRLERLCEMGLTYRDSSFGEKSLRARPFGGQEGSGYGEGDESVKGDRISGTLRWMNHPTVGHYDN